MLEGARNRRPSIVPGGAEAYRDLIRVHTTLDLEPEAIHATGLKEIERIDAEFVELGGRVLGFQNLPGRRLGAESGQGDQEQVVAEHLALQLHPEIDHRLVDSAG